MEQSEHRPHTCTKFVSDKGMVRGIPDSSSNIKDHRSQIMGTNTIIMKGLKHCESYPGVTQRHKVNKYCWKNRTGRLAGRRAAMIFC